MTVTEVLTEDRIVDGLQPIRAHVLAVQLFHLFDSGLYDTLQRRGAATAAELASAHALHLERLTAFLSYLRNEGILVEADRGFALTPKAIEVHRLRGWYTMFIGGYARTFLALAGAMQAGAAAAGRDGGKVGVGANEISMTDTIPLACRLGVQYGARRILDLGCGSGLYLIELCKALPDAQAWGVEPSRGGYEAAQRLVADRGLASRIRLSCTSAQAFVRSDVDYDADFAVVAFVLQEILGQDGEAAVMSFLDATFDRFPNLRLLALEVDYQVNNPRIMRHGLGAAFYNPYYLLHPFTDQRLESSSYWKALFVRCGLYTISTETIDPLTDSTGLVVGFVLTRKAPL
jgi:2-ketoarginine methyltransferase